MSLPGNPHLLLAGALRRRRAPAPRSLRWSPAGVSDVTLPHGFRFEAYRQVGVVGARRRDGFADRAVVVDHRLGDDKLSLLRVGALAAGAVQPGAARVDVGWRVTLRLPTVDAGSRIVLDWRQRVAGAARPVSGLALTFTADF